MCSVCVPENSLQVLLPYSLRVFWLVNPKGTSVEFRSYAAEQARRGSNLVLII